MFDEPNICIQNTILYLKYKKKVGSFWALYLMGIKSISDIKFTLGILVVQTLLGIISSFLSNQLIMQNETIDFHILICTIIICNLDKPILKIINLWLYPKSNYERRLISKRIADWVHNIFNQSNLLYLDLHQKDQFHTISNNMQIDLNNNCDSKLGNNENNKGQDKLQIENNNDKS